jgi:hypothetical protein
MTAPLASGRALSLRRDREEARVEGLGHRPERPAPDCARLAAGAGLIHTAPCIFPD